MATRSTSQYLRPIAAEPGTPLYVTVQKVVRVAIDAGVYAPGDRLPSTKDLSKQFEVSLVTVHRALQELVASGVLRRGQGRGTYVHEEYGRRAESSTGLRFGLVFHSESSLADYFHGQILEGVRQASDELGVDLVLLRFGEDWRNECQGYLYVNPYEAQLDRPVRYGQRTRAGRSGGFPTMVVGANFDRPGVSSIDTDNRDFGRQAVRHLYEMGHRKIGYVGGSGDVSNDRDRLSGFRETMTALGLTVDPSWVVQSPGFSLSAKGRTALDEVLRASVEGHGPTALFAGGYYFALDAYQSAAAQGLKIPDAISVVAVDDPASAALLSPALTTLRQPLIQVGRLAARGLFEMIGEEHPTVQRTMLQGELQVRKSTRRL